MGSDNGTKYLDSGLPQMTEDEKKPKYTSVFTFTIIPFAIGLAIAFAIYFFGSTTVYNQRIVALTKNDLQWAFAAVVVLGRVVTFVNLYPMVHKSQIVKGSSGNLRSNPFIYKLIGKDAPVNAVVFEDEGAVGAYNRANRSLHHMIENYAVVVAGLYLASTVFPFPVFLLTCMFGIGRIMHQVGYSSGYGGHGTGFALTLVAQVTLEGLLALVFLKSQKFF
ncbi:hypothetical protein THRCLA_20259 [Thraustotheca clavata]|uniref:Uncharacterized protein n=1 Tax=Thraustotheca clavata TaxID=74557 RepID=A0A1W0A9F7_9STRA|nr:hypothetical protein THRCLA_20259 [Thraustotheca clavata]